MMDSVSIIIARPNAIPSTEIRTIGRENLFEFPDPVSIRFAIKRSVFKIYLALAFNYKYESQKYYFTMKLKIYKMCLLLSVVLFANNINAQGITSIDNKIKTSNDLKTGASRTSEYLPLLKGKSIAVVANQASTIKNTHLVDSLISLGISIKKVFCVLKNV